MKKVFALAAVLAVAVCSARAEVSFGYDAGADIVSSYIWRGQYNGGLSLQPEAQFGFDSENMSFRVGAWANVGITDWKFQKGLPTSDDFNPNTYFVPEVDIIGSFSFYGASVGFNHYYYCDGHSFFNWKSVEDIANDGGKSTTEVWAGYNFGHSFGSKAGAYINWYTTVAGNDLVYDEETGDPKRAWSSYLEVGYDYTWETVGITLGAQVGMSPWKSDLYGNDKFAVTNVSVKFNKEWVVGPCSINLFAQISVNPDGINKDNIFIWKAGDEILYNQKLNEVVGVGFWF